MDLAQEQFAKAAELEPDNYETNHNLGEIYVRRGMVAKALPYLEKAQRLNPASYDNGYDLSLAYMLTGRLGEARTAVQQLLKVKETAELHNLLAQIEEKDGNFVSAAHSSLRPRHIRSPAKAICSIGAASCCCIGRWTRQSAVFEAGRQTATPIRPG